MPSQPTADPDVLLVSSKKDYWLYERISTGARWEVKGTCDRRGDCIVGAVIQTIDGPIQITSKDHILQLRQQYGLAAITSQLDTPVIKGFEGVCCPLVITEL